MANKNFVVRHGLEVSGNAGVAGNLGVSGTLSVGGDIQTTSLSITNGAQVGGALTVTGVTDLNSNLQVSGNTSLTGTLQVNGNTSLTGTLQVNGNTSLASNLDVGATLCVAGNTNIVGVTTIGGKLNINNDISSTGTLTVNGASYLSGSVQAKGTLSVGGRLTAGGDIQTTSLSITNGAQVGGALTVTGVTDLNGDSSVCGQLQVTGVLSGGQLRATSSNVAGTLTVQGASYLSGAVQAKGVLSGAQLRCTSLRVTGGTAAICGSMDICGSLQVASVLSAGQFRGTSNNLQRGNISAMTYGQLNGSFLSATTMRCASLRVTGGTAAICGSMDICGSLQVGGFVSANTYNFEMFGAVPAYSNSDYSTINWSIANSAIQLRSSTDTTIGMAFPAFRVNSATNVLGRWRITIQVKASAAASSGLYVRVYEYDGELPAGKVAVSNDASNAVVQEDTRLGVISGTVENVAVGTDWVTKTFYYTPTATAVYASIVVLNWTGIGTNHLYVRPPVIQPEYSGFVSATTMRTSSFRSTGALTVQGASYLSGSVQAKGVLSGLQLRCTSLRVTGGTAAICGSMDISGSLQVAGTLSASYISATNLRITSGSWQRDTVSLRTATGTATYDKIRVWTGSQYTIGMTQGLTFGGLGSDYAMTFTMNNDVSRGFLWRYDGMTAAQGAMSLTTGGKLTIAAGVRIGFGQGDTTAPASNGMQVNGTISCDAIHAGSSNIETGGAISGSQLRCTSFFMGGNGTAQIWGGLLVSGVFQGTQLRFTSARVAGGLLISGTIQGTQLRCTSLSVTGGGTTAICGGMDISGSLQVGSIISCNGLHAAGSTIQTTGVISGTTLRCASFRCTGFITVSKYVYASAIYTPCVRASRVGVSGNQMLHRANVGTQQKRTAMWHNDGVNYHFLLSNQSTQMTATFNAQRPFIISLCQSLVSVSTLAKGSGTFNIRHPVARDTHRLVHSFVESPLCDLLYRGKTRLSSGIGTVNINERYGMMSGTFEALTDTRDVFLTNNTNWDLIKSQISGAKLTITSNNPESDAEISWLVIGDRKDMHIKSVGWTDDRGKPILEPLSTGNEWIGKD